MSEIGSAAIGSAALGGAIALALVLATAAAGYRSLSRGAGAYLHASIKGTIWRMAGALVGAGVGLALKPASTAVFVVAFLAVYLAGHFALAVGFNAAIAHRVGKGPGSGSVRLPSR